jgi:hypothetical protein
MGLSLVNAPSWSEVCGFARRCLLTSLTAQSFFACQNREPLPQPPPGRAELRLESSGTAGAPALTPITETTLSSSTRATEFTVRDDGVQWGTTLNGRTAADIVVCWARATLYSRAVDGTPLPQSPGALQMMRWVSEAVSHSWGRYSNIFFYHQGRRQTWQECGDDQENPQIVVGFGQSNFADRGSLANSTPSAPTRVLIDMHLTSRDAVQQAAFVLFGQALRLLPANTAPSPPSAEMVISAQSMYGRRSSGMLVEWLGRCVFDTETLGNTGSVWPSTCFPNVASEIWRPKRVNNVTRLASSESSTGNGRCILGFGVSGSGLAVGDCANGAPIAFTNQQWKGFGDLCVAATSAEPQGTLALASCSDTAALLRWDFEFLEPKSISLDGSPSCLAVAPSEMAVGAPIELAACNSGTAAPEFLTTGQLSFGSDMCAVVNDNAAEVGAQLVLGSCTTAASGSMFHLSGRFSSGGRCATLDWAPPTAIPRAVAADCVTAYPTELAPDPLEWEYYW